MHATWVYTCENKSIVQSIWQMCSGKFCNGRKKRQIGPMDEERKGDRQWMERRGDRFRNFAMDGETGPTDGEKGRQAMDGEKG